MCQVHLVVFYRSNAAFLTQITIIPDYCIMSIINSTSKMSLRRYVLQNEKIVTNEVISIFKFMRAQYRIVKLP
jgi:hypothetical protein